MAKSNEELVVEIKGDVSDLLRKLDTAVDHTDKAGDEMGSAFSKTKGPMSIATKGMGAFAVAAGGAATAMIGFSKVMDHINSKVGLARMADRVGINVKQFQRLSYAAKSIGADSETLADAMKDLSIKITDASLGATAYEEALNAVGLKSAELIKLSPEEQFLAFADAVKGASKEMGDFAADEINDSMYQLISLLRQGKEGIEEFGQAAEDAGAILSESDLNELKEAQQATKNLEVAWDGVMNKLAMIVDGPLAGFLNGISAALKDTKEIAGPSGFGVMFPDIGKGADGKRDDSNDINVLKDGTVVTGPVPVGFGVTGGLSREEEHANLSELDEGLAGAGQEMSSSRGDVFAGMGMTREEVEESMKEEQEVLAEQLELMDQMRRESAESLAEFEQQKRDNKEKAEKDLAAKEIAIEKMKQKAKGDILHNLSSLMNTENKKMFEVGKAAAIGQAVMNTYQGATKALAEVPYPYNFVAAASVVAAGLNNVNNIKSQSFGSAGGGASSTGGAAGLGSDGSTAEAPSVQNITEATINIAGDNISGDSARALVAQLKEYQEDGGELVIK